MLYPLSYGRPARGPSGSVAATMTVLRLWATAYQRFGSHSASYPDAMPTRRDVLTGACGVAALTLGAALFAPEALAADGITRKKNGRVAVDVTKAPGLAKVGGVVNLGMVKGVPTALVRTSSKGYEALDLRCTHAGVPVQESAGGWTCPAHGSQFATDGAVTRGPARNHLATVPTKVKGTTLVIG